MGGKFINPMRIVDTFTIIPSLLMTIILVSVLGTNLFNLMLALSISTIPVMTRITRASVMVTRNNDYIESSQGNRSSDSYNSAEACAPELLFSDCRNPSCGNFDYFGSRTQLYRTGRSASDTRMGCAFKCVESFIINASMSVSGSGDYDHGYGN